MKAYLDNAATTAVAPEVLEAMLPWFTTEYGNASSVHSLGQTARSAVERARRHVADLIGAEGAEIVFTSGGTESDNLALGGIAESHAKHGRRIVTSAFEHPAVLGPLAALEKQGFQVIRLPVDEDGLVRVEDVQNALDDETILVSIMAANNEIGTLQPMVEIGRLVREARVSRPHVWFHADAVQAAGKIPISVDEWGVDLLSISGHKIHAPKGVGALYVRKGVRLAAQQLGGRHERDRRAGTENVPGIVALGEAARLARETLVQAERLAELRDRLENMVRGEIPDVEINGRPDKRLPNISNLSFAGVEAEGLLIALDLNGVCVSTGAACSSGSTEPSHVLTAMGFPRERIRGSLRLSLSRFTTREEIERVVPVLKRLVERQRRTNQLRIKN